MLRSMMLLLMKGVEDGIRRERGGSALDGFY